MCSYQFIRLENIKSRLRYISCYYDGYIFGSEVNVLKHSFTKYIYIEITVNGRIGLRLIDGLEMIKIVHRAMEIDIYLL